MRMTNEDYRQYAERHAPRSPVRKNLFNAFWIGGLICCLGQFFLDLYARAGLDAQAAATAESITMVFIGAALTMILRNLGNAGILGGLIRICGSVGLLVLS